MLLSPRCLACIRDCNSPLARLAERSAIWAASCANRASCARSCSAVCRSRSRISRPRASTVASLWRASTARCCSRSRISRSRISAARTALVASLASRWACASRWRVLSCSGGSAVSWDEVGVRSQAEATSCSLCATRAAVSWISTSRSYTRAASCARLVRWHEGSGSGVEQCLGDGDGDGVGSVYTDDRATAFG